MIRRAHQQSKRKEHGERKTKRREYVERKGELIEVRNLRKTE